MDHNQTRGAADPAPTDAPQFVHGVVRRLTRTNNLLVFVLVIGALAALAVAQTRPPADQTPTLRIVLVVLRVALPIAVLIVTATVTNAAVTRHVRRDPDKEPDEHELAPVFQRCKLISMALLTGAGLFGDACLLFQARVYDLVLAALPLILLLVTRPLPSGPASFVSLATVVREESSPASSAARSAGDAPDGPTDHG